ncbi:RNase A-like domain-containing protein [Denitromonas iodatirespirans]|uniref:RNase A-like domain-containing protein n=1 Tax=Denitromonas iodatirespirans TaxID=2795389 RepID=UPI00356B6796
MQRREIREIGGPPDSYQRPASGRTSHGVARTSGQLAPMSTVRTVLQKKAIAGKLYYILTAFPIP